MRPRPQGIVLDLDDTLYLERDYVRSGFAAVARHVTGFSGGEPAPIQERLWQRFTSGERGHHFDDLIASEPGLANQVTTAELVEVYRHHVPEISMLPGMEELLANLRSAGRPTAVISDGALPSQQAKAAALRLDELVDGPVALTDLWGREYWKPHPHAFLHVQEALVLRPEDLVYVGDNPQKDFDAPRALGWTCVRLRMPGQLHHGVADRIEPDVTVTSVKALGDALLPTSRLT